MHGGVAISEDLVARRPYNAVTDFVDSHIAQGRADKIAFIDPERSLTYGELQTRSVRLANALLELGVAREERVALLLHDTVDYPVAFWGVVRSGAIAIPLNTFLNAPQYAFMLNDSRASALIDFRVVAADARADPRPAPTPEDGYRGRRRR